MARLFGRQKDSKHYHTGYSVEDVHSNQTVVIKENSVLVGDIYAPQVIVAGMVYGYVVASEVIIEPPGQIWGDICATSVAAMPGSKVHGWISSLDEGTVDLLRLGQLAIEEVPKTGELATSAHRAAELEKLAPQLGDDKKLNRERIEIWRKLRSEAAAAVSARVELEQSFDAAVLETAKKLEIREQIPEAGYDNADDEQRSSDHKISNESDAAEQLSDAKNEVEQLRVRLAVILKSQALLQNQLIWTKASLLQSRKQQDVEIGNDDLKEIDLAGEERGRHLAKLQAVIVERDLKVHELQAQINAREEQLIRLKTLAAKRIESLEIELAKIQVQRKSE